VYSPCDAPSRPLRQIRRLGDQMKAMAGLLLTTLLTMSAGCAQREDWIDRTLVTVDVTGTWRATNPTNGVVIQLDLQQQGPTVKGVMRVVGGSSQNPAGTRDGPIEGTVAGDVFRFSQTNGRVEGELRLISEDEMDGPATISFTRVPMTFRRVAPPSSQEGPQPPR